MTSALQLWYVLRSPTRRNKEPIAAFESDHPDPEPDARRSRRDRRRVHRGEDGDHRRRSHGGASNGRHPNSCGSHVERELGRRSSRNGSDGSSPGNSSIGGVSNSMLTHLGLTRNDQLSGAVEEARKRLLERLQSVSLTYNRQRAPNDHVLNDEPALGWDAFCTMKGEIFRSSEEKYEGGDMEELTECCICLEGFKDGDSVIKLCCSHKFHPACLEPWVRSSGDCPLCRADII